MNRLGHGLQGGVSTPAISQIQWSLLNRLVSGVVDSMNQLLFWTKRLLKSYASDLALHSSKTLKDPSGLHDESLDKQSKLPVRPVFLQPRLLFWTERPSLVATQQVSSG